MPHKNQKFTRISPSEITNQNAIKGIQNFIISGGKNYVKDLSFRIHNTFFDFRYPHVCDGIGFAICTGGKARIRINLMEYVLEPNSIVTLLPNYILQIVEQDENLEIEFLMFSFDFISDIRMIADAEFVKRIQQASYLKIDEITTNDFLEFHAFILKQYTRTNYDQAIMKNLLEALINKVLLVQKVLGENNKNEMLNHKEEIFKRFLELLFTYYKQERSIKFYASKLFITPSHLSKIIKEVSQKSISEWIDDMVIMSAKAMLKGSNMTATQIAEELNFANPSFFGTYFKKRTGMTPLQYK